MSVSRQTGTTEPCLQLVAVLRRAATNSTHQTALGPRWQVASHVVRRVSTDQAAAEPHPSGRRQSCFRRLVQGRAGAMTREVAARRPSIRAARSSGPGQPERGHPPRPTAVVQDATQNRPLPQLSCATVATSREGLSYTPQACGKDLRNEDVRSANSLRPPRGISGSTRPSGLPWVVRPADGDGQCQGAETETGVLNRRRVQE